MHAMPLTVRLALGIAVAFVAILAFSALWSSWITLLLGWPVWAAYSAMFGVFVAGFVLWGLTWDRRAHRLRAADVGSGDSPQRLPSEIPLRGSERPQTRAAPSGRDDRPPTD